MKYTNNKNLHPLLAVALLQGDSYDYSESKMPVLSGSGLTKSNQEIILTERYKEYIEKDVIDMLWSVFGSAIHSLFENIDVSKLLARKDLDPNFLQMIVDNRNNFRSIKQEERLELNFLGYLIRGKFDVIFGNKLQDYKSTSAFSVMYGDKSTEWSIQLSLYRWLYWKKKGIMLEDVGEIHLVFKDWKERDYKIMGKKGYPSCSVQTTPVRLMEINEIENFLVRKIGSLKGYSQLLDEELPPCTEKESWYAPKKRIHNKCEKYCDISNFCIQKMKRGQYE